MDLEIGAVFDGKVTGLTKFGAFVELPEGKVGMVHISEIAHSFVKEIRDHIQENQIVKVKVLSIGEDGKISLSMKRAIPLPAKPVRQQTGGNRFPQRKDNAGWREKNNEPHSFEDMMSKFKQVSEEKISDLKRTSDNRHGGGGRGGRK